MTQLKILFLNGEFKDTGGKGVDRIPHQLSVDNHSFVYLTDENSHQILKFDGNGKFIKILESKGSKAGQFFRPHDIVFDSNNNMYVIDMRNSRVQIIDRTLIN